MDTKQVEAPVVVPDGVEYVQPEVREMAALIADELRSRGHWQGDEDDNSGGTCVINARGYRLGETGKRFIKMLCGASRVEDVFQWNDSNPTDVVLARLDAIAEGLVDL